jgi:hypothetical protein
VHLLVRVFVRRHAWPQRIQVVTLGDAICCGCGRMRTLTDEDCSSSRSALCCHDRRCFHTGAGMYAWTSWSTAYAMSTLQVRAPRLQLCSSRLGCLCGCLEEQVVSSSAVRRRVLVGSFGVWWAAVQVLLQLAILSLRNGLCPYSLRVCASCRYMLGVALRNVSSFRRRSAR